MKKRMESTLDSIWLVWLVEFYSWGYQENSVQWTHQGHSTSTRAYPGCCVAFNLVNRLLNWFEHRVESAGQCRETAVQGNGSAGGNGSAWQAEEFSMNCHVHSYRWQRGWTFHYRRYPLKFTICFKFILGLIAILNICNAAIPLLKQYLPFLSQRNTYFFNQNYRTFWRHQTLRVQ